MNKRDFYERLSVLANEIFENIDDVSLSDETMLVLEEEFKDIYEEGHDEQPMPFLVSEAQPKVFETFVKSSTDKNKTYCVKCSDGEYSCNCLGFEHRGHCKHVTKIQEDKGEN